MRDIFVEISGTVSASPETTFDVFAPIDLTMIFRGYGPLPAVIAVEGQTGGWDAPGQTRTIRLSDGSTMSEELTTVERPRHFAYRVIDLTGPFHLLVGGLRGAWWFESEEGDSMEGARTRVRWRYAFEPRAMVTRPLAAFIVKVLWRRNMQRALSLARKRAESVAEGRG